MESIQIIDLEKQYKNVKALDKVSLSIQEGELFGLLGVNGAGKTTLIKILSGLTQKTGGKAYVLGHDIDKEMEQVKQIIDVSPQETSVAPNLTVKENLEFFRVLYNIEDDTIVKEVISTFKLEEVLNQKAKTLSGGWQRRLSIAIAMISKPKILFLDEPTLGLDVLARRELWKIILAYKGKVTIVLTSHYLEEIEALCDRVAILAKGHLLAIGTSKELIEREGTKDFEDAFVKIVEDNEL